MDGRARVAVVAAVAVFLLAVPVGPAGATDEGTPPDPETDVVGWEDGYWYNESIDVDQSDGLSDRELDAVLARTMARVEYLRELEFERPVPVEFTSRAEFRANQQNRSTSRHLRDFDNAKFEALFLIGESTDSIDVQNQNAGSSILGFYSPARGAIVLISDDESQLRLDEFTLAHELVHALQDQQFGLGNYTARTRDEANAQDGLIEGDANLVQYRYRERCVATWECLRLGPDGDGGEGLANIGVYLVKFQPYSDGPSFVSYYHRRGGWERVNRIYANPPRSTEQVIHPHKYLDDPPTNVTLLDTNAESWGRVRPSGRPDYAELGEGSLVTMFFFPYYDSNRQTEIIPAGSFFNLTGANRLSRFDPLNYDHPVTAGWDGDRLHVYRNRIGELAYVWRIVWDSPDDAAEFYEGYQRLLRYWGASEVGRDTYLIEEGDFADAFHVVVDGSTVTIVNAPTVSQLAEVRQGSAPTPTPSPSPVAPPPEITPDLGSTPVVETATSTATTTADPSTPGAVATTIPSTTRKPPPTSPITTPGLGILAVVVALLLVAIARRAG